MKAQTINVPDYFSQTFKQFLLMLDKDIEFQKILKEKIESVPRLSGFRKKNKRNKHISMKIRYIISKYVQSKLKSTAVSQSNNEVLD